MFLVGCGSASSPSPAGPPVATDEVATPTETPPTQQAVPQQATSQAVVPPAPSFPATCEAIAHDIEQLGRAYPQLAAFRAADHRDCDFSYGFHTHAPTTRGGWSSAVPHPDPDGIWFYVGIYDPNGPDANSQIHMQPVVPNWWIGPRKVMFLILEGDQAKPAAGAIMKILERHGLETR